MKFKNLESERIILRELTEADAIPLFEVYSDKKAMKYWDSVVHTEIATTTEMILRMRQAWESKHGMSWGLVLKKSHQFIGQFSIHSWNRNSDEAKLGYIINPKFWGLGYGSGALKLVLNFGFKELGLKIIIAEITPENTQSSTMLEKNGFKLIECKKDDLLLNGVYSDTNIYHRSKTVPRY